MGDEILYFYNTLLNWDTTALLAVNGYHSEFWDEFMWMYSSKWTWLPLYASLAYVMFRSFSLKVSLLCVLCIILVITCSDQITSSLIRPWVARLRPSQLANPISPFVYIVDGYRGGAFSFPSAHAANSWGLTTFMILLMRRRYLCLFLVFWALLTCYSRLYLGVHYPGDLLAGMCIGVLCASVIYFLFRFLLRRYVDADEVKPIKMVHEYSPLAVGCLTMVMMAGLSC